jgi:4-amino-4-deoxy-L-arabinose transferase-like glycosyltransferase
MNTIFNRIIHIYKQYSLYVSVFIFFWAIFALTNSGVDSSEGLFHYEVAVQIIKHGQLGFATQPEGVFQIAPNGRFYAGHEIGNTLFMLPTAFINVMLENVASFVSLETIKKAQQFILSFQASIYSSITATLFFALLRVGFNQTVKLSFIATILLALTTFFWTYSHNLFDGVLCTTLLTFSFFSLVRYRQTKNSAFIISCFVALGFAFITRVSMVLAILVAFTYLLIYCQASIRQKLREFTIAGITLVPFVIWQFWYNFLRTGIVYKSPVQTSVYAVNNALDGNMIIGLFGLLFSPGKSIFIYAPLLLISVFLFRRFYRQYPKEGIYIAALTIIWFLLHTRLRSWYGAAGWGPRHLITILPILFLPFAVNLEYVWQQVSLRIITIGLAGFGFILALSSIISNWHFRMMYAVEQNIADDKNFIWGWSHSQAIDMLYAGVGNIIRIITKAPIIVIKNSYSEANEYASSTLNLWSNSLIYAGIPWFAVIILLVPLFILIYLSARNILHFSQQPKTVKGRSSRAII